MKSKKILYIQFNNPAAFPPIIHSTRLFAERGWGVKHLGCCFEGAGSLKFEYHPNIELKIFPIWKEGLGQKLFYLYFQAMGVLKALLWGANVIYVSDNLAAPAGWVLKNIFGKFVIYHEHDDPSQEKESKLLKTVKWFRSSLARTASMIIIPQRTRLKLFLGETSSNRLSHCVWNCPSRKESQTSTSQRQENEPLGIYYHGSINLERVSPEFVHAVGKSGIPAVLRIVGYETKGSIGTLDRLREIAEPFAGSLKLDVVGPLSRRSELIEAMGGMHVGWISFTTQGSEKNTVMRHLAGASNKAFDYLATGLMLIIPDDPEWSGIFSNFGKSCNPRRVEEIIALLRWIYDHPEEVHRMGALGQQKVREVWNYETQFEPVLRHIEELVSARKV